MCQFCKNKGLPDHIWKSHRVFNCIDPTNPQGVNYNNTKNSPSSQPIISSGCKVSGCDGRHSGGHYCRTCNDQDSDHWSSKCPIQSKNNNGDVQSQAPTGNSTSHPIDDEWESDKYDPSSIIDPTSGFDNRYEIKKTALVSLANCNKKWFNYLIQIGKIPKPFTQKAVLTPTKDTGNRQGDIILTTLKTDEAILIYQNQGTICIWDCGSGQKPLGGYLSGHGQKAQEEDVARKSTLSTALIQAKNDGLYPLNDGVLYSIGLTLLRTGPQFQKLNEDDKVNFSAIISAAPNMQGYFKGKTFSDVKDTIEEKVEKMFVIPEEEILVAAAWGCGSFAPSKQSDPQANDDYVNSVVTTIAKYLSTYRNRFKTIVFTLPDPQIYSVFEKILKQHNLI